jgi:hypothetical protein
VARPPSIRLQLAKLLKLNMGRLQTALESAPGRVLDVKESQMVLNMAKADALIRDRSASREEDEDAQATEEQREAQARELVAEIRALRIKTPAATVNRSGGEPEDDP